MTTKKMNPPGGPTPPAGPGPTVNMLPSDLDLLMHPEKFVGSFDTIVHGKKLLDWVPPKLAQDATAWVLAFRDAAQVTAERIEQHQQRVAAHATLAVTGRTTRTLDLAIQRAAVDHPEMKRMFSPKTGKDDAAHAKNLLRMRRLLDLNAPYLVANGIDLHLEPRHETAAVEQQIAQHQAAENVLKALDKESPAELESLVKLRLQGPKLQTKINSFLGGLTDDRALAHSLGFEERAKPRPSTPTTTPTTTPPAPPPAPPLPATTAAAPHTTATTPATVATAATPPTSAAPVTGTAPVASTAPATPPATPTTKGP